MFIIDIVPINKKKYKIICDDFAFALYKREISKYHIEIGSEMDEKVWQEICDEVLFKRAKDRALYLLESFERTEYQLYQKLKDGYYPIVIIERVIAFLKQYNYINDVEYARRYIECYMYKKSIKCIETELYKKGIKKDVFDGLVCIDDEIEIEQIKQILSKKKYLEKANDIKEKNKIFNYILRRGYSFEMINRCINMLE